ncbi:host-specificity protein [Salmonella enterica subsp. enterica]|nr:host-specificity protein [Salmonella enterica subsp. enterica]
MGKGGGSSKTPHEAPDDLKSSQMLTVVDAICEGPIEGPVDGLKSVRINKTPVLDSDGNAMVHGVTVVYRVGEDEQSAMEGFEDSGAETLLGVEVKKSEPVTRTITTKNGGPPALYLWCAVAGQYQYQRRPQPDQCTDADPVSP